MKYISPSVLRSDFRRNRHMLDCLGAVERDEVRIKCLHFEVYFRAAEVKNATIKI